MAAKSMTLVGAAAVLFFIFAGSVAWLVSQLIRGNQNSLLASVPFAREQEVKIEASGEVVVLLEVPRLASDFRDFEFDITERQNGNRALLKHNYFGTRAKVSGMSTVKIPYGSISLSQPGLVAVKVGNWRDGKDYSSYHLVFSRPFAGRMALQIIGLVVCGVGMLLCILSACWGAGLLKS